MHWLILTLLVVAIDCFNYNDCKIDGGTTYDSNGYTIIHTAGIDMSTSASNSLYPSATTYGTIVDAATLEMKTVLANYAITGNIAYNTVLQYVPFHLESGGTMDWYFFYSGTCATSTSTSSNSYSPGGCVVTQMFTNLITSLSGTWLIHEYAHAYHLSMGECTQTTAITTAYDNSVANKTAILAANGDSSDYYAWSNEKEYFAELSEAYFARNGDITDSGDWPRDVDQLENQDPIGYAAVDGMWQMTQSQLDTCMSACTPAVVTEWELATWMIVLIVIGSVLLTAGAGAAYYFFVYKSQSIAAKEAEITKDVELA